MSAALTLALDDATLARLDAAASARDMTPEAVAQAALDMFLDDVASCDLEELQPWQLELIEEGMAAARREEYASDEDVERAFAKFGE